MFRLGAQIVAALVNEVRLIMGGSVFIIVSRYRKLRQMYHILGGWHQYFRSYTTRLFQKVFSDSFGYQLTLSWRRSLSYRNQSIDLQSKSIYWFLCDRGLRHERVKYQPWKNVPINTLIETWGQTFTPVFMAYFC